MSSPIKITHLITGLSTGGAETMLLRMLTRTDHSSWRSEVISMMDVGPTGRKIGALGVRVRALGLGREAPNPLAFLKLVRWLRQDPPDVLAAWMYHANLIGSLAAPLAGGIPVVWGLHHARLDPEIERRRTLLVARACGWMSRRGLVSRIVCCAEASRREHVLLGYAEERMEVVRNGFDVELFRPNIQTRSAVRQELGIDDGAPVVTVAARYHPEKDHRTFFRAAAILREFVPTCHFVLCGHDVCDTNATLATWAAEARLGRRCHLLGRRDDVPRLLAASDLVCSSSVSEAFPLVVGEAMASGVPCVVTDVGDSADLVGDTGLVAPPGDFQAIADACTELLRRPGEERRALGMLARQRIVENFELSKTVGRYYAACRAAVDARHASAVAARAASKAHVLAKQDGCQ